MQLKTPIIVLLIVLLSISFVTGCRDGRPRRFPVKGVVHVDGKPLSGEFIGSVRFCPIHGGRPASAQLDSQGRFVLGNYETTDGCPKGEYKVEVNVSEQKNHKMRYLVPPRYWSRDTTDIVVTITGREDNLTIETQWRPEDMSYKNLIIDMNE